ncbi:MAG: hypothetical protein WBD41_13950 [Rhodococcus sp. (in: high G+C Gram-positive bacteria)]
MELAAWIAIGATGFFGFIAIHEIGHAFAARLIGIPANDIAVRLLEWPAHVALRSEGQWHQPGTPEYRTTYQQHDPHLKRLGPFIAAGFITQTIAMTIASATSVALGFDDLGTRLVRISIVINGLYLVGDAVGTLIARTPTGDMSSMLRHTPAAGWTTLAVLAAAHSAAWSAT